MGAYIFGLLVAFGGGALAFEAFRRFTPRLHHLIAALPHVGLQRFLASLLPYERWLTSALIVAASLLLSVLIIGDQGDDSRVASVLVFMFLGCFWRGVLRELGRGLSIAVGHASRRVGVLLGNVAVYGGAALAGIFALAWWSQIPGSADLTAVLLLFGGAVWWLRNRMRGGRGNRGH